MAKNRLPGLADPQASSEAEQFRAAVKDVKPLRQVVPSTELAKPKPRARLRKAHAEAENLDQLMPLVAGEPSLGVEVLSFHRAGVADTVMRRLRRGLYPCEDELDLHGLTQSAARDLLADFLATSRDAHRRCVRIIHGKGYRSGARGPVLKTAVNLWLRRHMDVMAFTSARTIDGGTGAVYVLLRG